MAIAYDIEQDMRDTPFRGCDLSCSFTDFIEDLPVAVFRSTLDGRLVFGNRALAGILGLEALTELRKCAVFDLCRDHEDRDALLAAITQTGLIEGRRIFLVRKDGRSVPGDATLRGVFDTGARLTYLDGVLRELPGENRRGEEESGSTAMVNAISDFIVLLDERGEILNINRAGAELLRIEKEGLVGSSIFDFVLPIYREMLSLLLSIVSRTGRKEGLLTFMDRRGTAFHLEFLATLIEESGGLHTIQIMARNVTRRVKNQRKRLDEEKFSGVMEMAGGVAHRLNQPLTIVSNTVQEVLSDLEHESQNYRKMLKIQEQLGRLHEIAKKIGRIRKYEAMDYVAGVKIVDIEKAS